MTNKEIQNIYFQGNEVSAVYYGANLVWKKENGGGGMIKGIWENYPYSHGNQYNGKPYIIWNKTRYGDLPINADKSYSYSNDEPLTDASFMFSNSEIKGNSTTISDNYNLTSVDVSNLDTSTVTNMDSLFDRCKVLREIKGLDNLDTSTVTNMDSLFDGCSSLTTLDLSNWNTSAVTNMNSLFNECSSLTTVYLNFDTSKVRYINYYTFNNCRNLTNVIGTFEGTKVDLYLSSCPLTPQSAMVFINGLAEVSETKTLRLSATTYDALTPEQIAIATSKGWTVTRP